MLNLNYLKNFVSMYPVNRNESFSVRPKKKKKEESFFCREPSNNTAIINSKMMAHF